MPSYNLTEWNGYKIKVMPRDDTRLWLRFIPYFYGPICFDLAFWISEKKDVSKESINYEWVLCRSEDDSTVKKGNGVMKFAEAKQYNRVKSKKGDTVRHSKIKFSKLGAIDLGHMSILRQYKVLMSFADNAGNSSDFMIMMEFTLEDRDHYAKDISSALVGAIAGAVAGGIVGFIVANLAKGQ